MHIRYSTLYHCIVSAHYLFLRKAFVEFQILLREEILEILPIQATTRKVLSSSAPNT